jgi:hypothetical protein
MLHSSKSYRTMLPMQFRWSGQIDGCHQDSEKDFHSSRREIRWPGESPH